MRAFADVVGDVLEEGAAAQHVEHLGAAADAEHRHVGVDGGLQQRQLPLVGVGLAPVGGRVGRLAVAGRVDVDAPRDHQPVDALEQAGHVELGRGL